MEIDNLDGDYKKPPGAAIIRSRILKEDVIVVVDRKLISALRKEYPDLVIYTPSEIDHMEQFKGNHKAIKDIHTAKKMFNGKIY